MDPEPRAYRPEDVVTFRKTRERFGGLSNMAPGYPLRIGAIDVRSAEALYQACRFPHRPEVQHRILDQRSPMTAKMVGKPFRDDTRPDWDRVRVPIMKWTLRIKLAQHPERFGDVLRGTGDGPIVEDSRKDSFWGAIRQEDGVLVGQNVLGRLLMELRERLRDDPETLDRIDPVGIERFELLGAPVPVLMRTPETGQPTLGVFSRR